jgi:hypothetical protein
MEKPIENDLEDDLEEIISDIEEAETPPPKKKREYVMTEARKLAFERMKEGRARKGNEALQRKANDAKILEKGKKELLKKKRKPKQVIVYDSGSSSEEENQVVIRRKRKTVKPPLAREEKDEIVEKPVTFRLKRL